MADNGDQALPVLPQREQGRSKAVEFYLDHGAASLVAMDNPDDSTLGAQRDRERKQP